MNINDVNDVNDGITVATNISTSGKFFNEADKQKLHLLLDELITKHTDNTYVSGRLNTYMSNLLPSALNNALTINRLREDRKKQLCTSRDDFLRRFLSKNLYFYSNSTELFLKYDDFHFRIYREDDIQHQILTMITTEQALIPWKYKIKNNIMKCIKERSPLTVIPESVTIQFVLNQLYPTYFATRNSAKYFLTVIGDSMTRATSAAAAALTSQPNNYGNLLTPALPEKPLTEALIYIISPLAKDLVRELANQCYTFFGPSTILSNIKFKYHDHQYSACRLIPLQGERELPLRAVPLQPALLKHTLDFLCVAAHYSARYGSADGFLQQCADSALVDHAFQLCALSPTLLVDAFISQSIITVGAISDGVSHTKITNKNMLFLWKKFLLDRALPNVLFYETLKTLLKDKLTYDGTTDAFLNVTSPQLPLVANFLKFWDTTVTEEEQEADELEIDELLTLYKQWTPKPPGTSEKTLLELIRYYYPDISIEDDKYILQVRCNLWDKRKEVETAMTRNTNASGGPKARSLYDAYAAYTTTKTHGLTVSKRYFDRVVREICSVDEDGGILAV